MRNFPQKPPFKKIGDSVYKVAQGVSDVVASVIVPNSSNARRGARLVGNSMKMAGEAMTGDMGRALKVGINATLGAVTGGKAKIKNGKISVTKNK